MRWRDLRRSDNVDDERGAGGGGGGIGLPIGRGGIGLVVVLIIAYFLGGPDLVMSLIGNSAGAPTHSAVDPNAPPRLSNGAPRQGGAAPSDEAGDLATRVLGSTEDVWSAIFAENGRRYTPPTLVLFSDEIQSACGNNTSATGPFYCPGDQRLYLDTTFFGELARLGGPGDFAQAYVIGHEVGHHVQKLLGTEAKVRSAQARSDERDRNRLQVAMELQADCYAGVWAFHANKTSALLEPGDVEEGLRAAAAIGDDRLQRNAGRRVSPDSFTHGSSADREHWLDVGLTSGDASACDTFAAM